METNPYDYYIQQHQVYQNKPVANNGQQFMQPQNPGTQQRSAGQKPGTPVKMPKARVLALANALKRTLAVASIISFGMFGGLVAMHQVNTTTTQSTQSTQSTSGSSNTGTNQNTSTQNSNNFFNQQGGNTSGTSSSSSVPVTGTTTS